MLTALLLRLCLCILFVCTLIPDTAAQRRASRRSTIVTNTRAEEKSSDLLELFAMCRAGAGLNEPKVFPTFSEPVKLMPNTKIVLRFTITQSYECVLLGERVKKVFSKNPIVPPQISYINDSSINEKNVATFDCREKNRFSKRDVPQLTPKTSDFDSKPELCQLKVYPNPYTTTINIEMSEVPEHGVLFNLYDLSGRLIKQEEINNLRTSLSLNQLSAGVYTYQVINGKDQLISCGKLVKGQ